MNIRSQGAPPSYRFVTRLYRSLRPIVIGTALLTAIWSLISGIGFYRNIGPYKANGAPNLATISIIIGSFYMCVFVIGLFGICAAATRKVNLIRIFAFLSALAVLIVVGIGLLRIVIHFTMKDTILRACTNAATNVAGQGYVWGGWWGPEQSGSLVPGEAELFCKHRYDRDSWSLIVGLLILSGLGIFFSMIAFRYLRQVFDTSNPANVIRDPHHTGVPAHYNSPYGPPGYNAAYRQGFYNYPADPPPGPGYDAKAREDMNPKNHDEQSSPSGEGDVARAKAGDPRS